MPRIVPSDSPLSRRSPVASSRRRYFSSISTGRSSVIPIGSSSRARVERTDTRAGSPWCHGDVEGLDRGGLQVLERVDRAGPAVDLLGSPPDRIRAELPGPAVVGELLLDDLV